MSGPSDEASELRIAIARVLERWQLQRAGIDPSAAEERTNLETLGERLRALESCREGEERWEDLAMIQTALIAAMRRRLVDPNEMLSKHIDELKRAITPQGGNVGADAPFAAEVSRAARLSQHPPTGDRIAATLEWIETNGLERARAPRNTSCDYLRAKHGAFEPGPAVVGSGGAAGGAFCDRCGATLGMVDDGDGSAPRLFCPQCQPDELPHCPVVVAGGSGRALRVRSLTSEEQRAMGEYLAFVQSEPLPASDAATRQRLFEARLKWPQVAALFGGGDAPPTCSLCSYPHDQCRCIANGWR